MTAFRTDTTELGDARRRVEELVCDLPGNAGERSFDHPWELRTFAMAIAAYHSGQYEWSEFQLSLISQIREWEAQQVEAADPWSYYEHWLSALEDVLGGHGLLSGVALDDRTTSVLATPRNANHHTANPEPVAVDPAR